MTSPAKTADMREKILKLEAAMLAMPEHQIELPLKHSFIPGVYMRELFIPKGAALVGKLHKTEHLCILSQGEISVETENGIERLKASAVFRSLPGAKRVIYAHEDSVFINVHSNPTDERDPDKLEDIFIAETFEEIPGPAELKLIEEKK